MDSHNGITIYRLKVAIGTILGLNFRRTFDLMSLRREVASDLRVGVGDITVADMQSALDQLEKQGSIEKNKDKRYKASAALMNHLYNLIKISLVK